MLKKLTPLLLTATLLVSCNIKEDRGPCPFNLVIDMSKVAAVDGYTDDVVVDIVTQHNWHGLDRFPIDNIPASYEIQVPKDTVFVLYHQGNGTQLHKRPYVINIIEGDEMEPISTGLDSLYCNWEEFKTTARIWKNYSEVFFVLGEDFDREVCDYSVEIDGNVCGISIRDNAPIPGHFACRKTAKGDTLSIKVPRQAEHTLMMKVYKEDVLVTEYPLGQLLSERNFNWGKQLLDNAVVNIGYNCLPTGVEIREWSYNDTVREEF